MADYDIIVIGSGFGGSVTALRLTEKGYRVGRPRGRSALHRRQLAEDVVGRAQLPVGAEARPARHAAHPRAPQCRHPGRRRRRWRVAQLRQHAVRAAAAVLRRSAMAAHHRLARRARPVLRAGAADARRHGQSDDDSLGRGDEAAGRAVRQEQTHSTARRSASSSAETGARSRARPSQTRTSAASARRAPAASSAARA